MSSRRAWRQGQLAPTDHNHPRLETAHPLCATPTVDAPAALVRILASEMAIERMEIPPDCSVFVASGRARAELFLNQNGSFPSIELLSDIPGHQVGETSYRARNNAVALQSIVTEAVVPWDAQSSERIPAEALFEGARFGVSDGCSGNTTPRTRRKNRNIPYSPPATITTFAAI